MWPADLVSNSCFATKPVKISGALCGRVFDASGAIVQDVALRVVDDSGKVIADTKVDQKGDFILSNLSKGRYRLDTPTVGWLISSGGFEITSENASSCRKPVRVYLGI